MGRMGKILIGVGVVLAVLWYMGRNKTPARVTTTAAPAGEANNVAGIVGAVSGGLGTIISAFRPGPVQG